MQSHNTPPKVVIFDDCAFNESSSTDVYMRLASDAASEAKWLAEPFDVRSYALDELSLSVDALIVSLTRQGALDQVGKPLFAKAREFYVPTALLAPESVLKTVKHNYPVISGLIPRSPVRVVQGKLVDWLSYNNPNQPSRPVDAAAAMARRNHSGS